MTALNNSQAAFSEIWAKRLATGDEIICVAADTSHESTTRIAIGTRNKVVQLFKLDQRQKMYCVFSLQFAKTVPAAIEFVNNPEKHIEVYSFFDGQVFVSQ
jgi:hypothetical protein